MDAWRFLEVDLTDVFKYLLHEVTERSTVVGSTFVDKHASKWLLTVRAQVNFIDVVCLSEQLRKQAFSLVYTVYLNFDFFIPSACLFNNLLV